MKITAPILSSIAWVILTYLTLTLFGIYSWLLSIAVTVIPLVAAFILGYVIYLLNGKVKRDSDKFGSYKS